MSFLETVEKARAFLERNGRVSLRALKREFNLDDDALGELIEELVEIQRVAVRDGSALAWAGGVPPAPTGTPEHDRDPRAYTPKHLADKILQSKSAIEGERKQVTVLFADVKGSMDLQEGIDPEEWHGIMDRFFQILTDGVHRFEGTVNQYTGDGIMALFGAPIAHEDHAQRACYAALALRDELERYADDLRRTQGMSLSTRIGINSGEVVVGKIGDDLRMDYTAQGHTVGLAQRMEQCAAADSTYLTAHTARLVEGYFQLRDLGDFELKGVDAPLRVHELQGVGALRTRLDSSRSRGFSKFVGREREMASLESALEGAIAGHGQVIGVVADAGIGKSRLCLEFVERCRSRGIRVNEAHCPAHGKTVPYLPLLEMLRDIFGIESRDSDHEARRKIAGELMLLDETFQTLLPILFEFMGVADPTKPAPPMSPEGRQQRLFAFVRHLVQARGEREPSVLFLDDLHWIDPGSDAFLAHSVEAAAQTRTLWLVNFRPEYQAAWMGKSYYEQLPLRPLGAEAIAALLADLLGNDASVAALPTRIHERTGGNPFFVEEIVQSLVESGSLEGTKGSYRLVTAADALEIPGTVQSVLSARLDRLPEREKRLLQTASVIGKEFSDSLLRSIVATSGRHALADADLVSALAALGRAEFIYEQALYPEVEYAFKHPLTQEVAYRSQLATRRAELHAAVARAIEHRDADKLDERAALIAYHWELAGEALTAAQWHARAARVAGFDSPTEALRHWGKVWGLLDRPPESPEASSLKLEAAIWTLAFGYRLGLGEAEAKAILEEGRELAVRSGDLRSHVNLLWNFGVIHTTGGDPSKAQEFVEEAFELAAKSSDPEVRFVAYEPMADFLFFTGRPAEAVRLLDASIKLGAAHLEPGTIVGGGSPVVWAFGYRGWILTEMGRLDEADESLRKCEEETRRLGMTEIQSWTETAWASNRACAGDVRGALTHARRAVDAAEKVGSNLARVWAHDRLGVALALDGEWDMAVEEIDLSLRTARETQVWLTIEAELLAHLAEAHLGSGDPQQAQQRAVEAIDAGRRRKTPIWEAHAHLTLARVLLSRTGRKARGEIESALESCLSLVEQTQARVYEPHVYELRAELAHLLGDAANRERYLRKAHRSFTEIGATGHAERLARELGL